MLYRVPSRMPSRESKKALDEGIATVKICQTSTVQGSRQGVQPSAERCLWSNPSVAGLAQEADNAEKEMKQSSECFKDCLLSN
eukprot:6015368-Heterocapsa_arctica.AAC.1